MTTRKKQIDPNLPLDAKLCISKEQFRKDLEERIALGKELLEEEIPSQIVDNYGSMLYAPRSPRKIKYNEDAYNEWNSRYEKWDDYNKEYLKSKFDCTNNTYLYEYQHQKYSVLWGEDVVKDTKDNIKRQISKLESFCEKCELFKLAENLAIENDLIKNPIADNKNVFIVHGHDGEMKQHVARVLDALGLKPIILHEQANGGKTIIEKFEYYGKEVSYAVVLLTGDDEFFRTEKEQAITIKRARQNVVFEMGYFMGRLGRNRVCVIRDEESEKVGDIDGIIYTPSDGLTWIMKLVKELQIAGYDVDANKALKCL